MEQLRIRSIRICGSGSNGLLLTGSTDDVTELKEVDVSELEFVRMAVGGMFGVASTVNFEVVVWGVFQKQTILKPKTLGTLPAISSLSCGWEHAVLLDHTGAVFGLGCNKYSQLMASTTINYYEQPVKVAEDARLVVCGFRQTYLQTTKNAIYGRGQNRYCELTAQPELSPEGWALIDECGLPARKMDCGKCYFAYLDDQAMLFGCGNNSPTVFKSLPAVVEKVGLVYTDVADFAAGWKHLTVSFTDGRLMSYGGNSLGQLGHDSTTDEITLPKEVDQNISRHTLTSGTEFTFCSTNLGVYAWGWNEHNNLSPSKMQVIEAPILISSQLATVLSHGATTFLIAQQ